MRRLAGGEQPGPTGLSVRRCLDPGLGSLLAAPWCGAAWSSVCAERMRIECSCRCLILSGRGEISRANGLAGGHGSNRRRWQARNMSTVPNSGSGVASLPAERGTGQLPGLRTLTPSTTGHHRVQGGLNVLKRRTGGAALLLIRRFKLGRP